MKRRGSATRSSGRVRKAHLFISYVFVYQKISELSTFSLPPCLVSVHSAAEEIVLYPAIEKHLGDYGQNIADKSREEHLTVKNVLYELDRMNHEEAGFHEKLAQCFTEFDRHAQDEEQQHLPQLRRVLDDEALQALGHEFDRTKKIAPTLPLQTSRQPKPPPDWLPSPWTWLVMLPVSLLSQAREIEQM